MRRGWKIRARDFLCCISESEIWELLFFLGGERRGTKGKYVFMVMAMAIVNLHSVLRLCSAVEHTRVPFSWMDGRAEGEVEVEVAGGLYINVLYYIHHLSTLFFPVNFKQNGKLKEVSGDWGMGS
jgi:hypothetical protein